MRQGSVRFDIAMHVSHGVDESKAFGKQGSEVSGLMFRQLAALLVNVIMKTTSIDIL